MDTPKTPFCDVLGLVKAVAAPRRRAEAERELRNFWLPDESCRKCYECCSQFTLFNRRHHCRHCGRIFCDRCSSRRVPLSWDESKTSLEERDKVRVCNYCFEQWETGLDPNDCTSVDDHGAVWIGEEDRSIWKTILIWLCPNREEFVATSSLYAAYMITRNERKDTDIAPLDIYNGLLWLPPEPKDESETCEPELAIRTLKLDPFGQKEAL